MKKPRMSEADCGDIDKSEEILFSNKKTAKGGFKSEKGF